MTNTWSDLIESWATAQRAARLSPQTIALRTYHVGRLGRWAGQRSPWDLTLDDLLEWTGTHQWMRDTARSVRSSLRAFWRWGVGTGRTMVAVADGLPPITPQQPRPRPARREVVHNALLFADDRTRLMVRLANELGLRRGEVAQVHSDDLTRDLLGWSLLVHGKGARDRTLPVEDSLAGALRRLPAGWAFPGAIGGHLSARWVGTLVTRAMHGDATMHQLRHLCATELHEQTRDLRLVQEVLGHASLATTQRYVAVRDDAVRSALSTRSRDWSIRRAS